MSKNHILLKKMVYIVTLAAVSVVLSLFEIPLGLPWLKLDLSEIVILTAFIMMGFKETVVVVLIRGFMRQFIQGDILVPTELWGEFIAMMASMILLTSFILFSKIFKREEEPLFTRKACVVKKITTTEFIVTLVGTTVILTFVMIAINILFTTPIYLSLYAQLGVLNLNGFHFSVFTLLDDPGMTNIFGIDLSNWNNYLTYIIANYALLNVAKGILTSLIFIPLRESLIRLDLNYL